MPTTAQGLYAAQSDIEDIYGITNIATWSQLDPTQPPNTPDIDRIQRSLDYAEGKIISFFRNYGNYLTPLAPQNNDITLVKRWSATLAGVWLYQSRGLRDDTKDANKYTQMSDQIFSEMAPYRSTDKLDAARRWPAPTAPTSC